MDAIMTATTPAKTMNEPNPMGGAFARGLRTRVDIHSRRLDAIRHAMGGASAAALVADDEVRGVALLCPLMDLLACAGNFCPAVAQSNRAVEDRPRGR